MHNCGYRDGQGSVLLFKVLVILQIFKTKPSYTVVLLFAELGFTPSTDCYLDYVWERQANK